MGSSSSSLRREEAAGLVIAVAAHVALVAWLTLKPPAPAPVPPPERMTVTFTDEVALKSTSPKPKAEAAAAVAPVLSPSPVPQPAPEPKPVPQPVVQPQPLPKPPLPRPMPAKPVAQPVKPQPVKPQPAPAKAPPRQAPAKAGGGGSRLGSDFLKGLPGGQTPGAKSNAPPADAIGPAVKSALAGAVARQIKPNWNGPSGVDVDQLATTVEWDLNRDGTLASPPRVVGQTGVTDANRAQAERHKEQAIRAVRITRFDLPDEYYEAWKHVRFTFNWKLTQ